MMKHMQVVESTNSNFISLSLKLKSGFMDDFSANVNLNYILCYIHATYVAYVSSCLFNSFSLGGTCFAA